jgi:hypothetical protein
MHRIYDATRDPEIVRFYHSKEWLAFRGSQLREHPICQRCEREASTQVHHMEPLKQNWERRLDPTNVRCLCGGCHKKTEAENRHASINAAQRSHSTGGAGENIFALRAGTAWQALRVFFGDFEGLFKFAGFFEALFRGVLIIWGRSAGEFSFGA